jgi:hypothetical protein
MDLQHCRGGTPSTSPDDVYEVPCPSAASWSSSSKTVRSVARTVATLPDPKLDLGCAAGTRRPAVCGRAGSWPKSDGTGV